jgi:AcrR family transcriptional regulator
MRVTTEAKEATRLRILRGAQELFRAQGFEATTTRHVAQAAGIANGTLFNYFATKEAIVAALVSVALEDAQQEIERRTEEASSLDEALFALVAAELRHLRPLRRYLGSVLESAFSPLTSDDSRPEGESLRRRHLARVGELMDRYAAADSATPLAQQLYWSLYVGVLTFWAQDRSPKQEDTLALLDESVQMFAAWLQGQADDVKRNNRPKREA